MNIVNLTQYMTLKSNLCDVFTNKSKNNSDNSELPFQKGENKMQEKQEEMKEIFNKLTDENKDIINMVAKGMQIAQENGKEN